MKSNYDVYRPSKLIQDFYVAPAYYHAKDVNWSPFTPVGKLERHYSDPAEGSARPVQHDRLARYNHRPVQPALFVSSASLASARPLVTNVALYKPHPDETISLRTQLISVTSFVATYFTGLITLVKGMQLVSKKYTLAKGVQADFSGKVFTFAKLSAAGLVALAVIAWTVVHTPSQPLPHGRTAYPSHSRPVTITPAAAHTTEVTATPPNSTSVVTPHPQMPWAQSQQMSSTPVSTTQPTATTSGSTTEGLSGTTASTSSSDSSGSDSSSGATTTSGGSGSGDGTTGSTASNTTGGNDSSTGDGSDQSTSSVTIPSVGVSVGDQPVISTGSTTLSL